MLSRRDLLTCLLLAPVAGALAVLVRRREPAPKPIGISNALFAGGHVGFPDGTGEMKYYALRKEKPSIDFLKS